jgi:hypothetical protein
MAASASLRQARRPRREDPRDDRREASGDLRLPRRQDRKLLPDDPVGKAHNEMLLNDYLGETGADIGSVIDEKGKMLV